jgi:hypothetical protein
MELQLKTLKVPTRDPGPPAAPDPSAVRVTVYYRGRRLASVHGRNLFACGMELELRSASWPIGTLIDLELPLGGRTWQKSAEVVHRKGSLVGVVFRGLCVDPIQELARNRAGDA